MKNTRRKQGTYDVRVIDTLFLVAMLAQPASAGAVANWPDATFRVGGDTEGGAPYSFFDPNDPRKLVGFEVEISNEIAKRTGAKPVFVQNAWASLIQSLNRGDTDVVLNGIEVTREHAAVVDFSRPYYVFEEELTVRADESQIKVLEDLTGHRVGTLSGALSRQMLEQRSHATIVTYDDVLEPYQDLALGRTDAVLLDLPIAAYYAHTDKRLKIAGPPVGRGLYAAAVRKGDTARLAAIDGALASMIADGTLKKILQRWHLWNDAQVWLAGGRALTDAFAQGAGDLEGPRTAVVTSAGHPAIDGEEEPAASVAAPDSFVKFFPPLLGAAAVTLLLTVCSFALAVLLGLPIALVRIYAPAPAQAVAITYVEIMRGTPPLIQLLILYYGLPQIGLGMPAIYTAILGLGLNYAAYESEVYRAAITSVPGGQMEAALSLGMNRAMALRYVILPQAMRIALPPSTNDFIALFKDSSLVSVITVVELTKTFQIYAASTYSYGELGAMTAALYLAMSLPLAAAARRMEATMAA